MKEHLTSVPLLFNNVLDRIYACSKNQDMSHIKVLKNTNLLFAEKFINIMNDNLKKYQEEWELNKNFVLDIETYEEEAEINQKEIKLNIVVIKLKAVNNIVNDTELKEKLKNVSVDLADKSKNMPNTRVICVFEESGDYGFKNENEKYLFQVSLLRKTIDDFLSEEKIHDSNDSNWGDFIKHCNFLQTMNYRQSLMSDAIYSLILDNDFVNKNFAYQSTIFRSLKYHKESLISYLKDSEVRKLRSVIKIITKNNKNKSKEYLLNGFISQLILDNGYAQNLLNEDILEITNEIVNTDAYQERDGVEFNSPFKIDSVLKINKSLKKSKEGLFVENVTNEKIISENYINIELNTAKFYPTLGIKNNNVLKEIFDEIFFNVLEKTNYSEKIYLNIDKKENSDFDYKFNKDEKLKNHLYLRIDEADFPNLGSIKKYIDDVMDETSKVMNNIYSERWVSFANKSGSIEDFSFTVKKILNQTKLVMKNEKSQEIISNMRKNELMSKLNLIGKETERVKRKL